MMSEDSELLGRYLHEKSQDAFAELVRRHLDLVHSAALRQVCSPQLAEEISQSVFTDLARDAHKLKPDTVLTAWLYQVARRTAIDVVRRESRRQARERLAVEMAAMNTASDWTQIEPLLDDAMDSLDETDRSAILLRYFDNKPLREVGQALGTSEDAAQKRVSRAVERLREFFSKRGVTVGAAGLVAVISANAVQAAPAGLAITISAAAIVAGTAVQTFTAVASAKAIAMTTLQKILATATIASLAGMGIYEARQASALRQQIQALQQQQVTMIGQVQQLKRERDDATSRISVLSNSTQGFEDNLAELLKLRSEVGLLRRQESNRLANEKTSEQLPRWTPEQLTNSGRTTPLDALQTLFWAGNNRNLEEISNSIISDAAGPQPTDVALQEFVKNFLGHGIGPGFLSFTVISTRPSGPDRVQIDVDQDLRTYRFLRTYTFQKVGDEWKAVVYNWRDAFGQNPYLDFERPRL